MGVNLNQLPIPRKSIPLLVSLLGVTLLVLGLGYWPSWNERGDLEIELMMLRDEIKAEQAMAPVWARISREENLETEFEVMLQVLEPALMEVTVDSAAQVLAEIADVHALGLATFTPIPTSLLAQRGELLVEGRMRGSLANFREFLLALLASPAVQGLELLEIKSRDGLPDFRMRLWLVVV